MVIRLNLTGIHPAFRRELLAVALRIRAIGREKDATDAQTQGAVNRVVAAYAAASRIMQ
jgi:hypothetical protein